MNLNQELYVLFCGLVAVLGSLAVLWSLWMKLNDIETAIKSVEKAIREAQGKK